MDPVFFCLLNDQGNKKNKLGCYNIVSILQHRQHPRRRPENKVLGGEDIMGLRLDAVRSWSNFFVLGSGRLTFPGRHREGGS